MSMFVEVKEEKLVGGGLFVPSSSWIGLIDLTESINVVSDKFNEYEEDRAKKDKIIKDLISEMDSL